MALSAATISTHGQLQATLDLSREAGLLTPELQRKLQTEIYTRARTHAQCLRWHPIFTLSHAPYLPPPQPSIPVTLDRLMIKPKLLTPGLGSTWMSQEWHRISGLWPDSAMAWMSLRQTLYLPEIPTHYLHCPFLYTQLPYHHRMESTESTCTLCYIALRSQPVPQKKTWKPSTTAWYGSLHLKWQPGPIRCQYSWATGSMTDPFSKSKKHTQRLI